MVRVERREFSQTLQSHGAIDLRTPAGRELLGTLRLDAADLAPVAGRDEVIQGVGELGALFDRLRELDRLRPARTDDGALLDRAAALYEAVRTRAPEDASSTPRGGPGISGARRRDAYARQTPKPGPRTPILTTDTTAPKVPVTPAQAPLLRGAGGETVASYLEAVEAHEHRGARGSKRPNGVSHEQWACAKALELQGVTAEDVRRYLETGTFLDQVDADGRVLVTGAERVARLEQAAVREGRWTAVNSLTFLVGLQRAALAEEREALAAEAASLSAESPVRATLEAGIEESAKIDREMAAGLQRVYAAATAARESTSRALLGRARTLEARAEKARTRGDAAGAEAFEKQAEAARDRGARMAFAEAQYRAGMRGTRASAGSTFRIAAEAQIERGAAEIARLERLGKDVTLPQNAPAVLGGAGAEATPNQVPGAEVLLADARGVDPKASRDHEQLALEAARHGVLAGFHRLRVERSGYLSRVEGGVAPTRTPAMLAARQAYLEARVGELRAQEARASLYGAPASLTGPEALEAQRVERRRVEIGAELSGALGTSLAADRRLAEAEKTTTEAQKGGDQAREGLKKARAAFGEAVDDESDVRDRATGLLGDVLKTSGEASRDRSARDDAAVMTDQARAQLAFAADGEKRALAGEARAATALVDVRAQATRDRQDAELVRDALGKERPTRGAPTPITRAYELTRAETDASARRRIELVARAEAKNGPRDAADRVELAGARVEVARWLTASTELHVHALADGRTGGEGRLREAGTLLEAADAARAKTARGDARANLAFETLSARGALAEAWSDTRPTEARDHLRKADATRADELTFGADDAAGIRRAGGDARDVADARGRRLELFDRAGERLGISAVNSFVRSDFRRSEIADAGQFEFGVRGELYRTAHRLLPPNAAATPEGKEAARLLARVDTNLAAVPGILDAAATQASEGQSYAAATTRAIARAELAMAQSQVSSIISGPVWLVSSGLEAVGAIDDNLDMKEEMARAGMGVATQNIDTGKRWTQGVVSGANDLRAAWTAAEDKIDFIDALALTGDADRAATQRTAPDSAGARAYGAAGQRLRELLPEDVRRRGDHSDFLAYGVLGVRTEGPDSRTVSIPVARALTEPTLGLADAKAALGDPKLAVMLAFHHDSMIQPHIGRLNEVKKGQWRAWVNLGGEVIVGFVATGGLGSARAVQGAVQGANLVKVGAQGASFVRTTTMLGNAARAAGHTAAFGGAVLGANYGMKKLFGANSTGAATFEHLTNFIPASVTARSAGVGRVATGVESRIPRLAEARRMLGASALVGGQAVATGMAVEHAVDRGWIKSEGAQLGLGLGLNVLFAGAVGALGAPRAAGAKRSGPEPVQVVTPEHALARAAGVDPAILDGPAGARPREAARLLEAVRRDLPADAREALDLELQGRRFVDQAHYEEARASGTGRPEHRYGANHFEAWRRADALITTAARDGRPLTVELLSEAHALATEHVLKPEDRGRLRRSPKDVVRQGGEGPLGIQAVTPDQLEALRSNPDLRVADLGVDETGHHRVLVEYLKPEAVEGRLREALAKIEARLERGDDPVAIAADAQREVVSIHPFMDGNGRTSRLVMDYVLQRKGLPPAILAHPDLDTGASRAQWEAEVRRGVGRPLERALETWRDARTRERAGVHATPEARTPGVPAPSPTDLFSQRPTLGWSGEPTARPAKGREHLRVIHQGLEALSPKLRARLDLLLARAEEAQPELVAQRRALGEALAELSSGKNGRLLSMPDKKLTPAEAKEKAQLEVRRAEVIEKIERTDQAIHSSRKEARALAVAEMERLRRSLLGESAEAEAMAARLHIDPKAEAKVPAKTLRSWAAEFYRLTKKGRKPEELRLTWEKERPHASPNGDLNVGDRMSKGLMFHELGHYLEFDDPSLAEASKAWVRARSEHAGGGRANRARLNDLPGGENYRPDEHAFEDHFFDKYIGKDYGAEPTSEVITVGLEQFTNADRMLDFYRRDPEHFFFVLGALKR